MSDERAKFEEKVDDLCRIIREVRKDGEHIGPAVKLFLMMAYKEGRASLTSATEPDAEVNAKILENIRGTLFVALEMKEPSLDKCDRSAFEMATIASNGIFWRNKEIAKLREEVKRLTSATEGERDAKFADWWDKDGRYLDPDPQVDWYDKRRDFAELAFVAGQRNQSPSSILVEKICRAICKVEAIAPDGGEFTAGPNWVRYADAVNQILLSEQATAGVGAESQLEAAVDRVIKRVSNGFCSLCSAEQGTEHYSHCELLILMAARAESPSTFECPKCFGVGRHEVDCTFRAESPSAMEKSKSTEGKEKEDGTLRKSC